MPDPATKASPLKNKKVLIVGAVVLLVGWYLYKRYSNSAASVAATTTPAGTAAAAVDPNASLGASPSAGAPAANDQTTSDLISSLGGENASLIAALTQVDQNVSDLASSQIAYAQTNTNMGSFNTQTQPAAASQPGGSNAPVIYYMAPSAVAPQAGTGPAAAAPVKAPNQTPTRYFSYKRDVPLASGQTVHFTSGRGYYAAA